MKIIIYPGTGSPASNGSIPGHQEGLYQPLHHQSLPEDKQPGEEQAEAQKPLQQEQEDDPGLPKNSLSCQV